MYTYAWVCVRGIEVYPNFNYSHFLGSTYMALWERIYLSVIG